MDFLLYGAYGYTGSLIARRARSHGLKPLLAGRDAAKLHALCREIDVPGKVASLNDPDRMEEVLRGMPLVLNCAGPFEKTAGPMLEACLRTKTHYLDITGEASVLTSLSQQDRRARDAGITVLPGVGFDVLPSDSLAAHLKRRLPGARYLELAILGTGGFSRGTAKTAIDQFRHGGLIRREGELQSVAIGWRAREVDFGRGPTRVLSIPLGDVVTAYHSTGIPNIIGYAKLPSAAETMLKFGWPATPLFQLAWVRRFVKRLQERRPLGPTPSELESGQSYVWGKVMADDGRFAISRLRGPQTYALTADSALAAVKRVLASTPSPGFQTPATVLGPDAVLELDGVERTDVY